MKSIALISPRGSFCNKKELEEYLRRFIRLWTGLSSSLTTVAALTPPDYQVTVIDENVEAIDLDSKYDLVGITSMTQQAIRAYEIADQFRRRKVPVVMGGIHATIMPDEALCHADSVVIGEAEYSWPELIRDFERGQLKTIYRDEREVDLKDSPAPLYELVKDKGYKNIWVQASRGCPHDCEFCAASKLFGRRYRRKTISQVISEVRSVRSLFGNKITITFSDDNFFVDQSYAIALMKELAPLKIKWGAQSDISVARKDAILEWLRPSGCAFLYIGFESIHGDNLKNIDSRNWKLRQLAAYSKNIQRLQTNGILVFGSFIIGLEDDTPAVFENLKRFILENHLAESIVSILTPYPGTALRQRLEKDHRLLNNPWDSYTHLDVNIVHRNLTGSELQRALADILGTVNAPEAYRRKMKYFKEIYRKLRDEDNCRLMPSGAEGCGNASAPT